MSQRKIYDPITIRDLSSSTGDKIDKHPDMPELPFLMLVVGPSRVGKSNAIKNILTRSDMMKPLFDQEHIFIICPSLRYNDDYEMLYNAPKFDEFSNALIKEILDEQTSVIDTFGKKRAPHILIILDDIADSPQFANSRILQQLAFRGRHAKISLIVSVQKFSAIPRGVRINATNLVIFRPSNFSELDHLTEELADKDTRKELKKVMKNIFKTPYEFIYFDMLNKDMNKRIRQGFSKSVDFSFI